MPPVFKKAKEYDPALANKTLGTGQPDKAAEADNRQLLIELGLADESDGETDLAWEAGNAQGQALPHKAGPEDEQQAGGIAAYYPGGSSSTSGQQGPASKVVERLRARLEASMQKLQTGCLDDAAAEEVQELLFDQQHQIDLLLRGHFSLRGSMDSLRRSSKEVESKQKVLQEDLEQQHGAALREMEGKLEKAIQQVQQLQQATRDRQQQQEANAQQSMQAAGKEVAQLKAKVEELQEALSAKSQALSSAHEQAGQQTSTFRQELQHLAKACQSAQQEIDSRAAALQLAQQEVQELKVQLGAAVAAHTDLQQQCGSIRLQLEESQTATQQQAAATSAEAAAKAQQLEAKCIELAQQLEATRAEKAALQLQVAELTKQEQEMQDKQEGLQQQLVAAVQARSELQVQFQQLEGSNLMLQAQCQQADAQLASAVQQQAAAATNTQGLTKHLETLQQQAQQLQADKTALGEQLQQANAQLGSAVEQHRAATTTNQELAKQQEALQQQVQRLQAEKAALGQQVHIMEKQQHEAKDKLTAAESDSQKLQWKISALQAEHQKAQRAAADQISQLQDAADKALAQLAVVQAETDKRVAAVEGAAALQVEGFKQKWREEFEKRRKLHNMVVELKGNIRVLARIRPMIEKEHSSSGATGADAAVCVIDEETVSIAGASVREYEFDRVFGPADGQKQVFQEVSGLVTSILDGFNVCIMAYGQTGSGKTYTIEGPAEDPGVNSRALAELFKVATERSLNFSYAFSASVLEIYNEQIFDLLAGSRDTGDKLDIKEGPQGLFIPGLRIEPVAGVEDVTSVLQKGKQHRSTFATNMNEHSSRSHLVLTIYVKGQDVSKGTSWSSKMHLIDLAGSERVSRSGAEGERLKEAAAINKSLSALGDVVAALQQRSSHVPYRNSKLTRLLEDSLGGSSKTLMVVNCSPAAENVNETKCSLEFAARARKVELGAATRHLDGPGSPSPSPAGSAGGSAASGGSPCGAQAWSL